MAVNEVPDAEAAGTPARPTLLIVDDLPANLGVLLDFLDSAGYEVLVAESGAGALLQLEYARPDLILLDVQMPGGMDGYATCEHLKADARWRDIPVLLVTALSEPMDKVRGFAVGAVDFITKPLHPEEVLARVRAHLQIRALQRRLEASNARLQHAVAMRVEAEEHLAQSLDRAVIVARDGNVIEFCSHLARCLLSRYFPEGLSPDLLPDAIAAWSSCADPGPWQGQFEGARLEIRRFAESRVAGSTGFMLLLEETLLTDPAMDSPVRLKDLGLTAREAEVLYWIAHGKSSPEISVILDCALNTVKKHVQNVLLKLGVESRLAAALRAVEVLGLPEASLIGLRSD